MLHFTLPIQFTDIFYFSFILFELNEHLSTEAASNMGEGGLLLSDVFPLSFISSSDHIGSSLIEKKEQKLHPIRKQI